MQRLNTMTYPCKRLSEKGSRDTKILVLRVKNLSKLAKNPGFGSYKPVLRQGLTPFQTVSEGYQNGCQNRSTGLGNVIAEGNLSGVSYNGQIQATHLGKRPCVLTFLQALHALGGAAVRCSA